MSNYQLGIEIVKVVCCRRLVVNAMAMLMCADDGDHDDAAVDADDDYGGGICRARARRC